MRGRWIGAGLLLAALMVGYLGTTPWGDALRHGQAIPTTWTSTWTAHADRP